MRGVVTRVWLASYIRGRVCTLKLQISKGIMESLFAPDQRDHGLCSALNTTRALRPSCHFTTVDVSDRITVCLLIKIASLLFVARQIRHCGGYTTRCNFAQVSC